LRTRISSHRKRRTWLHGDGRHDGDGWRVSVPVMRLCIPLPDLMRHADGGAAVHAFQRARVLGLGRYATSTPRTIGSGISNKATFL
jgi:hypothetical protein